MINAENAEERDKVLSQRRNNLRRYPLESRIKKENKNSVFKLIADTAALLALTTSFLYLTGLVYTIAHQKHWNIPSTLYDLGFDEALTYAYFVALAVFDIKYVLELAMILLLFFLIWGGSTLTLAVLYKKRIGRKSILSIWRLGHPKKRKTYSIAERYLEKQSDNISRAGSYLITFIALPTFLVLPILSGNYAAEKNIEEFEKRWSCVNGNDDSTTDNECDALPTLHIESHSGTETIRAPLIFKSGGFIAFEKAGEVRVIRTSELIELRTKKRNVTDSSDTAAR